ncbi:MAG: hypothetical protein R6V61_11905 [Wenzhouxiangellaceae bacterium]
MPDEPEHPIPYESRDYLELVDWSGRAIIEAKRGSIPDNLPPTLERLKIAPGNYIRFIKRTRKHRFHSVIGTVESMRNFAGEFGRTFLQGQNAAAALFNPGQTSLPSRKRPGWPVGQTCRV